MRFWINKKCLDTKPVECGCVFVHENTCIHTYKLHFEICSSDLGINHALSAKELFVLISREGELNPSKLIYLFTIEYVGACMGLARQKG